MTVIAVAAAVLEHVSCMFRKEERKPQTLSPRPQTVNPKPQTINPKPQTYLTGVLRSEGCRDLGEAFGLYRP